MTLAAVSGATGFIGQHLCRALSEAGIQIRALGRHKPSIDCEFVAWDIADPLIPDALAGVDMVFHLAGKAHALAEVRQDQSEYYRANTESTRQLLETAQKAGVNRFVLMSSVKAMGEGDYECEDELAACHPETPYGESKLAAEDLVLNGGYVSEPVVLRLCTVFGKMGKGNLPKMIRAVRQGRFPPLPLINNRRSMVHVEDVVHAAMLAAREPQAAGQVYIVTDGHNYSTSQIYEWICEALHRPVPGWHMPLSVFKLLGHIGDFIGALSGQRFVFDSDALEKLTSSACYSSKKIERELGFCCQHDLRGDLPDIVAYLEHENAAT